MARARVIMHVFLTLTFTFLVTPAFVTSQVNSTLFEIKGCFYDNFEYDVLPDLITCNSVIHQSCLNSTCNTDQPYCQSEAMTVDLCFEICTNQNARYFGLQDGSQCFCGGAFAPYDSRGAPLDSPRCNKNCTGNPEQMCGESFQLLVYEIKDPTSDCFHPGFLNVRNDIYPPVDQGEFFINDTLEYNTICQSPSTLTGTPNITCTESNWTEPPPVCTILCPPPEPMPYVTFETVMAESFDVGDTVSYNCLGNDTTFTTTCDRKGLWLADDCPVTCPKSDLPIGGALVTVPDLEYFAVEAIVDFVCDGTSFSRTFVCGSSGSWNISSFVCPDITSTTTTTRDPTTPTVIIDGTMAGPETTGSTTLEVPGLGGSNQGWIVAVAVVIPLLIIIVIIIGCIICYRKRREEEQNKNVPQVVLGYIKKRGTISGTLKRQRDPEKDATDNPEGETENVKKSATLTHSLSSMKQQFVKRVTLSRNRPELPPKKNPKKSSSGSITSLAGVAYVAPKAVRAASEPDVKNPMTSSTKRVSITPSVDNGLDEVFKSELRTSRSSEMLDALMVEFDGRVNHGYDNEESSARSSPSLVSKNSPTTERVVVHAARPPSPNADETPTENGLPENTEENAKTQAPMTSSSSPTKQANGNHLNGEETEDIQPDLSKKGSVGDAKDVTQHVEVNGNKYIKESPYDSPGEPKPAPAEIVNVNGVTNGIDSHHYESTIDRKRPDPLTLNTNGESDYKSLPRPESPQYATLADVQPTTPPFKHDYVNVGRGNAASAARISAEFHHPRPPSLPPDSP